MQAAVQHCKQLPPPRVGAGGSALRQQLHGAAQQHAALLSCHGPPTHRQGHAGGADIKGDDEGRIGFENYMAELTRKRDELVKRTEANQKWIVSPGSSCSSA